MRRQLILNQSAIGGGHINCRNTYHITGDNWADEMLPLCGRELRNCLGYNGRPKFYPMEKLDYYARIDEACKNCIRKYEKEA